MQLRRTQLEENAVNNDIHGKLLMIHSTISDLINQDSLYNDRSQINICSVHISDSKVNEHLLSRTF